MRLRDALRIQPGQAAAFVGAGGKTSALRRLISEFEGELPVLVATSTKLARGESDLADRHLMLEPGSVMSGHLSGGDLVGSVLLTGPMHSAEPKWTGLTRRQMDDLIQVAQEAGAVLFIEADGASRRSIKAPAAHEPAIPEGTDLVVPVMAIDVLGERIDSQFVHRPELLAELLGLQREANLTVDHLATLLSHPNGGLKSVPEGALIRPLINKVTTDEELGAAGEIARLTLNAGRVESVSLGAVQADDPVIECRVRCAAIVLAAGQSQRFGGNKLLHHWEGRPILEYVLDAVRASAVQRRVLVLGHDHDAVLGAIDHSGFEVVVNPDWAKGQSSSVKAGLASVVDRVGAAVYPLGDMPMIEASLIDALCERHAQTLAPIVAPQVAGEWGNPVLFDRVTFPSIMDLSGDPGGKPLFERYRVEAVEAGFAAARDVDRPVDVERLKE